MPAIIQTHTLSCHYSGTPLWSPAATRHKKGEVLSGLPTRCHSPSVEPRL